MGCAERGAALALPRSSGGRGASEPALSCSPAKNPRRFMFCQCRNAPRPRSVPRSCPKPPRAPGSCSRSTCPDAETVLVGSAASPQPARSPVPSPGGRRPRGPPSAVLSCAGLWPFGGTSGGEGAKAFASLAPSSAAPAFWPFLVSVMCFQRRDFHDCLFRSGEAAEKGNSDNNNNGNNKNQKAA